MPRAAAQQAVDAVIIEKDFWALLLEAHHSPKSLTLAVAPMSMYRHLCCIAEGHETR